jgi:hypothetical protein
MCAMRDSSTTQLIWKLVQREFSDGLREMRSDDAQAFLAVHHAAVRSTAAKDLGVAVSVIVGISAPPHWPS